LRVFIGLREVAGYFSKLNEGFQSLGIDSTFVTTREHAHQYGGDADWMVARAIRYCVKRYAAASVFKPLWGVAQVALGSLLLMQALLRYDVFVFAYGTSFVLLYDLPLLKLLGKKIIFVYLGTDARPPYLGGSVGGATDHQTLEKCLRATRSVKRNVERIERYADAIISLPTFGIFQHKAFITHAAIGFPRSIRPTVEPVITRRENTATVRILHSPSKPVLKGTPYIEAAIKNLRDRGYAIEWVTLSGQPNEVVLRELANCDFVVDQLYADWLMPGLATEAALLGKPTLIAGYDLVALQQSLPPAYVPPVHACHPDDIETAIEKLIVDVAYRQDLGQRAQTFVRDNWTATRVAERFLRVINGDIPADWLYDPHHIRFFHGGGVARTQLLPFVRAYIDQYGRAGLYLSDKPEVEQALLDFAAGE
jgi:hypothetical protein